MKSPAQTKTETQMLSAIALFCYSASVVTLIILGYSLITLALNIAGQEIGALYSPYGR